MNNARNQVVAGAPGYVGNGYKFLIPYFLRLLSTQGCYNNIGMVLL